VLIARAAGHLGGKERGRRPRCRFYSTRCYRTLAFACAGPRAAVSWRGMKLLWILPAAIVLASDQPDFAQRRAVWHQSCDAVRHEHTRANLRCEFQLWELNAIAKRHGWAPVGEPLPLHPLPVAR
jgi:hypothetical protein